MLLGICKDHGSLDPFRITIIMNKFLNLLSQPCKTFQSMMWVSQNFSSKYWHWSSLIMGIGFALCREIKIWTYFKEFTASSKYPDRSPFMWFGSSWGTSSKKNARLNKKSCQKEYVQFNQVNVVQLKSCEDMFRIYNLIIFCGICMLRWNGMLTSNWTLDT
jgi:hypothetical protein